MRDILSDLIGWQRDGESIAVATVIQSWGSSPRKAGSKMALTLGGGITGSVSGGCVENAVIQAGVESLKTKQARLLHFGVTDETAWQVGLACGGSIDVFVKPLDPPHFEELRAVIEAEGSALAITVVSGPAEVLGREILIHDDGRVFGSLDDRWDEQLLKLANQTFSEGSSRRILLNEGLEIFLEVISPSPTLVILGGVHIAVALVPLARILGYRTIVIDPRSAWGNSERFPHVDQLIQLWPQAAFDRIRINRSTAIVVLTHDPKLDDPALKIALPSSAFYVGALGSKTTHAKRRTRLTADGLSESLLARLHAPIGLDIGAQSPEEIALAIMGEVVEANRKQDQPSVESAADFHPAI